MGDCRYVASLQLERSGEPDFPCAWGAKEPKIEFPLVMAIINNIHTIYNEREREIYIYMYNGREREREM